MRPTRGPDLVIGVRTATVRPVLPDEAPEPEVVSVVDDGLGRGNAPSATDAATEPLRLVRIETAP